MVLMSVDSTAEDIGALVPDKAKAQAATNIPGKTSPEISSPILLFDLVLFLFLAFAITFLPLFILPIIVL